MSSDEALRSVALPPCKSKKRGGTKRPQQNQYYKPLRAPVCAPTPCVKYLH